MKAFLLCFLLFIGNIYALIHPINPLFRKCVNTKRNYDGLPRDCPIRPRQASYRGMIAPGITSSLLRIRNDDWYVWTIISLASTAGLLAEKTNIGATLSSPLVSMLLTMILCNLGLLPSQSPIYSIVMKMLVPLAVPLLLLDADMKKCINKTGYHLFSSSNRMTHIYADHDRSMLKAFLVGSIGTIVGSLVAYMLVPMKSIAGSKEVAAALCARHIGGAVNFVAVAEVLHIPSDLVAAAMAADNVIVAAYFTLLFAISSQDSASITVSKPSEEAPPITQVSLESISMTLSLAFVLYSFSYFVGMFTSMSPLLLVSLLVVALATGFPKAMGSLARPGGILGVLFMQLFFSVTGSMGHIPSVIKIAPLLFLHASIQVFVHFITLMFISFQLKIPYNEMIVASNANVGGPTTAAAMASNKRWSHLVLPALLTGVFGYAIATIVGLVIVTIFPFLPTL